MKTGIGIYIKNSAEAVDFYLKTFELELGYHVKNDDGSYYHSELCKDGNTLFCVVEGKGSDKESLVQLCLEFPYAEDVKRIYEAFCNDGASIDLEIGELPWSPCAASVIDRFGVWWYFSSASHLPDESFDPKKPLR